MRYSKRMRRRQAKNCKSLTSHCPILRRDWRPIRRTWCLTCINFGQLRDHSRGQTVICIPTGIRLVFLTTSLLPELGGDVVIRQVECGRCICPEVERWSCHAEKPLALNLWDTLLTSWNRASVIHVDPWLWIVIDSSPRPFSPLKWVLFQRHSK